mmetsp:Transcript_42944/g.62934  ORF Transcript_42944/g.62934 Transcript_42944/m.62934 type:complete len:532 (+) Transcript_42944:232-1827(+)
MCGTFGRAVIGISIGIPVMAEFAESLGLERSYVGLVFSVGALASLPSNLLLPAISDFVGRKPLIILALCGSSVSFAMQAMAQDYTFLFLAVFLGGLSGGTQSVAVAYISDIYAPLERPRFIGMVPACASACLTIGPAMGGTLSNMFNSYRSPFAVSAGIVFLIFPLIAFYLPDSKALICKCEKEELKRAEEKETRRRSTIVFANALNAGLVSEDSPLILSSQSPPPIYPGVLRDYKCYLCFLLQFINSLAFTSFITCVPLVLLDPVFDLSGEQQSVFLAGMIIGCGSLAQTLGLVLFFNRVQKRYGLKRTIFVGTAVSFSGYIVLSFQRTVPMITVGFILYSMGNSVTRPGVFAYVTMIVPQDFTARAVALPNFGSTLARLIAPIASTQLLAISQYSTLYQIISLMLFVQLLIASFLCCMHLPKRADDKICIPAENSHGLTPVEFMRKLSSYLMTNLSSRHYNLSDINTQEVIVEAISQSLPFLREGERENKEDIENLMDELCIPNSTMTPCEMGVGVDFDSSLAASLIVL